MHGDVNQPYRPAPRKSLAVVILEWCCGITVAMLTGRLWVYALTGGAL